jgi:hypothetical protein
MAGFLSGGASKIFAMLGDIVHAGLDPHKP